MESIRVSEARANLYKLVERTVDTSTPVQITSNHGDAVLISLADWNAIQETLYLSGIPGMVDSIKAGMNAAEDELVSADGVEW